MSGASTGRVKERPQVRWGCRPFSSSGQGLWSGASSQGLGVVGTATLLTMGIVVIPAEARRAKSGVDVLGLGGVGSVPIQWTW